MSIRLDVYRVFCSVAENHSFSKAAKELYMTQPAVSQAIIQLENQLGIRLFTRMPRGVTITNEGQLLYEYINSAMNLIKVGEQKLLEAKELLIGELKVGVGDTISRCFLLPYLERFHNESPGIKLRIINRTTLELCDMLKSGEIDIAICNLPVNEPTFEVRELKKIQDVFVCGNKFRHLAENPPALPEIVKYPLILLETKSNSRQYVEKYFQSLGIKITPEIELGSHELLLEFAKINLGIACVIREFSEDYLQKGIVHEIKVSQGIPARSIGCCFLKSVSLSPASSRFVEILKQGIPL
jgi:DNA-binding transcriptional LysR family regulator